MGALSGLRKDRHQDLAQHSESNNEISVKSLSPGGFRRFLPKILLR
jgi:hypothetical protein